MGNVPIYPKTGSVEGFPLATRGADKKLDREKLKKSCADFESILINQVLKSARQTVTTSGFMGNGLGKGIYESLLDQELSQSLAKRGGLGLGKIIYNRMIQQEERREATFPETDTKQTDPRELKIPSIRQKGNDHAVFGR